MDSALTDGAADGLFTSVKVIVTVCVDVRLPLSAATTVVQLGVALWCSATEALSSK